MTPIRMSAVILLTLGLPHMMGGCSPAAPAQQRPLEAAQDEAALAPLKGGHGSVVQVGAQPIALGGHRLEISPNDWLLRDGSFQALVNSRLGRVVALGRRGGNNGLVHWQPEVREGLSALPLKLELIEALADGRLLHIVKRGQTRDFTLHTWLRLDGEVLTMRSQVVAEERPLLITLGERVAWGNTPTWVEGHGFINTGGNFGGAFIARQSLGVAYASCRYGGPLLARLSGMGLPGFHRLPRTGERLSHIATKHASDPRTVALALSERSLGDAAQRLPCVPPQRLFDTGPAANATEVEVVHCELPLKRRARLLREAATAKASDNETSHGETSHNENNTVGPAYARFRLDGRRQLPLPQDGCLRARLLAPGHRAGAWFDPRSLGEEGWGRAKILPQAGTLRWKIRDAEGKPLAAKLVIRGVGDTPWANWGDDPHHGASRNFVYTIGDGRLPVPPGEHEVFITRGPEYSMVRERITMMDGEAIELNAQLSRVLNTRGWISSDLHVHALPSFDSPARLSDRIRSLAAVNVEVAVATDHNAVTDYRPVIAAMALTGQLASVIGDEVTVDERPLGHFNVFPLMPGSAPLPWLDVVPKQLFAAARQRSPGGIIQVNHPSMGSIGYFDIIHLDPRDTAGWLKRSPDAAMRFDAIEVFNGDHYGSISAVQRVMQEWFALLDAGVRATATGNSDSHKVAYQEAGMPRNWVAITDDDPAKFNEREFIDSIKRGRVVVSSGPFIRFTIDGHGIGDTVPDEGAGRGGGERQRQRVGPAEREHTLRIEVSAADWAGVDEVRLLIRGQVIRSLKVPPTQRTHFVHQETLTLRAGDWLIVEAQGDKAMPHLYRGGARPFAFTNPIWVE